MISEEIQSKIRQIRQHLFDLHTAWNNDPLMDGHHKSNEGYVGVILSYPNWFEATDYLTDAPHVGIEVYSYLFGPHRLHEFDTVDAALKEVLTWRYFPNTEED